MNPDCMAVSLNGRELVGGIPGGQESFWRHTSLQAGPRSEELTGEASRASIASAISTVHVTVMS